MQKMLKMMKLEWEEIFGWLRHIISSNEQRCSFLATSGFVFLLLSHYIPSCRSVDIVPHLIENCLYLLNLLFLPLTTIETFYCLILGCSFLEVCFISTTSSASHCVTLSPFSEVLNFVRSKSTWKTRSSGLELGLNNVTNDYGPMYILLFFN